MKGWSARFSAVVAFTGGFALTKFGLAAIRDKHRNATRRTGGQQISASPDEHARALRRLAAAVLTEG